MDEKMPNPLTKAIRSGDKANDEIGKSFARMGTSENPRGFVLAAYRNAQRALAKALTEPNRTVAAREVMSGLRTGLASNLRAEFADMVAFGKEESARQMSYYGVKSEPQQSSMELSSQVDAAILALTSRVSAQEASLMALLVSGADDEEILGTDERAGTLRTAEILAGGAYWAAALVWAGFSWQTGFGSGQGQQFQKQAIAAIDSRTTECCLRVHGQIQPLNKPFILTGEPRFADKMDWPGFHNYCRTSAVLYDAAYDLGLTAGMQTAAERMLQERAAGKPGARHPAHARS
jgi:hypothetical protein